MKKAPPPDPHRENFKNLGQGVDDYDNVDILILLTARTTEARRLMGPCFPTGGWFVCDCLKLILFVIRVSINTA